MASIAVEQISSEQAERVIHTEEGQFGDVKSIAIAPAKLTKAIPAFANSDGGDQYLGVDECDPDKTRKWNGFSNQEAANGHLQIFEKLFPLGTDWLRVRDEFRNWCRQTGESSLGGPRIQ